MSSLRPASSVPPENPTIDRSAAASAKGPRLQRLRVALLLLKAAEEREVVQAYAAVEAEGDAFVATSTTHASSAYSEEDKNYDKDGAFTIASDAVLNSLVLFLDQWLNWKSSAKLRFGLYTTVTIGKERYAGRAKELGLQLPAKPVLELLRNQDYSDPCLLPCLTALVLHEYEEQYKGRNTQGHLAAITAWPPSAWLDFLGIVTWLFAEDDEAETQQKLVDMIKKCRFYSVLHEGKEDIIASALVDLFDQKQLAKDFAERFVHACEVELLFRKVASGEIEKTDPTWCMWDDIPEPTDQRSIGEKLTSACPSLSKDKLTRYQRRTAAGLVELQAHSQDKNVVAMRYQIFDACEAALEALVARAPVLTESQLDVEIDNLTSIAMARVEQRSSEYAYSHRTETFVRGIVLELFDSCFLALDTVDHDGAH